MPSWRRGCGRCGARATIGTRISAAPGPRTCPASRCLRSAAEGRPMSLHAAAPVAALWRRSAAYIVDSLIIGIAYILLAVVFDAVFGQLVEATPDGTALVVVAVNPVRVVLELSLIHISEPTRLGMISYAVFCL